MRESGRKNRLETESVGKLMLKLCTQTTFSMMLYNVYTITDTLYVSRGVGSIASGAIGIFAPLLILIYGISSTLGVGGGSVISRKLGENDLSAGKKVVGCMIWIWLLCGGLITITGLLFLNPILALLGCTEEIYPYAVQYGRIMLLSTVISTGFSGIMQGIQPMLGFDWGRRCPDRIKKTVLYAICFSLVYGSVCAAALYLGSESIIGIFSPEAVVNQMGKNAMEIICWSLMPGGIMLIVQAYFQALGNGKKVLFLALGSIFIIRLPLIMAGKVIGNITAIWWIFVLSDWLIAVWAAKIFIKSKKEYWDGKLNEEQAK